MRVCALASGSSGNATLVSTGRAKVLIDAGLPTRMLERALRQVGVAPLELSAILLTHEHSDHVAAAGVMSRRYGIPLIANEKTLRAANLGRAEANVLPSGNSITIDDLNITSFRLPHDGSEPVGFRVECGSHRVCLATDLGYAFDGLDAHVQWADLIILEANHDRQRLLDGPYPKALKERVAGKRGHLSNEQTAHCVMRAASGRQQALWLAHLSAVNNSPLCALRTVTRMLEAAGVDSVRVAVAGRDRPSQVWDSGQRFVQLKLTV